MRRLVAAIRTSLLCWVLALSAIALCAIAPVRSWVMRNWLTWIFCAKVASSVPMAFRVIQALLAGQLPLKAQPAPAPAHAAHEEPAPLDVGLDTAAASAAAAASTGAAPKRSTRRSKLASMFDDDDDLVCKPSSTGTSSSIGSLRSRSSLQRRDSASTIFSTLPSAAAGACCCGSELDLCGPPVAPIDLPMPVKVMGPRWLAPPQHAAGLPAAVVGAPAAAAVVPAPGPMAVLAVPPAALAVPPAAPAAGPAPPVLNPYRQMLGARAGALGSGVRAGSGMVGGAAAAVPAASGHPGGTPPLSLTYQARTRCQLASVKVRREPTDFAGTAANLVKHAAHAAMQQAVNAFQPPSPTSGACPSSGTVIVPSHIPLHPPAQDSAQHSARYHAAQAQQKPASQPPMLSPTSILSPATSSCADGSPAEAADGMAAQPPTAPAAASAQHAAAPARPQQQLVAARGPGAAAGGPGANPLAVTVQVVAVRGCVQLVASMHHVAAHSLPQQPTPRVRLTAGALQAEMHSLAACMLSRSSSGEDVAAAGAWAVRAGSPDLPNTPDIRSYSYSLHSAGSAGSSDALLGLSAQQPYELVPVVHNRGAAANACMDEEGVDNGVAAEGGCACVGTRQEWQLACVWPPCIAAAPEAQVVELLLLRVLPGSAQAASFTVRDGQGQGVKATVSASAAGTGVHASSTAVAVASLADWALQWADHSSMPPSAAGSAQHASSRAHARVAGPAAAADTAADGGTPRIGSFSSTSSIAHAADAVAGLVVPDAPGAAAAVGVSSAALMHEPAAPSAALPLSSALLEAHVGPANADDMLDDDPPVSPLPSRASFASCAAGGMRPWLDDDSAGMLCGSPRSSLFSFLAAVEQPADGAPSSAVQPPGSAPARPPNSDLEVRVSDPVSSKPAASELSSPLPCPAPGVLPTGSSPGVDAADEAAGHAAARHAAAAHVPAPPAMEADEFESMQDDEAGDACPPIVVPVLLHGARPLGASSTAAAAAPSGAGYLQGLQGWDPVDHPAMARNHHHMARNHGHVARSHDHLQPPSGSALSLQDYAAAAAAAGMVEEGAAMAHDLLGGQLDGQDFEHGMDGEEEGEGLLGGAEQRVRVLVVEPQGGGVVLDTRVVLTESALQQGHARVRVAIPAVNVSPSCLHIYVLDDNPLTAGAILAAPVLPVLPEIAARELTGFAHQQLSLSMYSSDEPAASVGDQVRCGLRCWQDLLQPLLTDIGFLLAEAPPSPGMDAMAMDPHGSATSPLHGEGHAVEEVAAAAGGSDKEQQQVSFRVAGEGTDSPVVTTSTLHLQDEATREVLGHTTAFLSMHGLPDTAGVLLGRHGGAAGLLAGQPLADDDEAGFAADAALAAGAGGSAFGAAGVAGSAPVVHIDRVGSAIDSSGSAVLATVFSAGMGSAAADQQQEELAAVSSFGADLAAVAQAAPPQQPVPDEPRGDAAPTPGTSAVVAGAEYGSGSAAWTTVPPEAYAAASSSGASRGRSSMAGSSAEASSQARASDELADSWEPVSCSAGSSGAGSSKLGAGSNSGGTVHAGSSSSSSSAVGTAAAEGAMAPQVRLRWAPLMGFARTQEAVYTQTLSTWYAHMDLTSFVILMLMFLVVTVKLIRQSAPAYNITMLWVVAHTVVGPYWVMLFKPQTYKRWREPLMLAMQVLNGCLYLCFATGWTQMPPEMTFHFNHSHIIQRGVVRPVRRPMRFRTHLLGTLIEAFCVTPAFASYANPAHMWRTTALTYTLSLLVGYTLDYLARKVFVASQAAASSQVAAATTTSGCSVEEDAEGDAWLDPACAKAGLRSSAPGGSFAQSEPFNDLPTASCSSAASWDKPGAAAAPWKAKVA